MENNIPYEKQVTVCVRIVSKLSGDKVTYYSIRKEGHLFWTGKDQNMWVEESSDLLWETTDKSLAYLIAEAVQKALIHDNYIKMDDVARYNTYYNEALSEIWVKCIEGNIEFPYEWETENAKYRAESITDIKVQPKKSVQMIEHKFTVLKTGENF